MSPAPAKTAPWTSACLVCNETWSGGKAHKCVEPLEYRREFWVAVLHWALPSLSLEEMRALVSKPFTRARLAELLGPSWATDDLKAMPMHNPSFLHDQPAAVSPSRGDAGVFDSRLPKKPSPALHGEKPPTTAAARRAAARKRP